MANSNIYNSYYKNSSFKLIDNYIYLYHLDQYIVIPTYPDTITDSMQSNFSQTNALARSAPVFSYNNSGPRSVQINLDLHRDMLDNVNYNVSNLKIDIGDDYIDTLIKQLQAISVPKYIAASKNVQAPMIAVRFGKELFIKGIVNGQISVQYNKPILENDKYAQVNISFNVTEIDPYDAETIAQQGSFRGITRAFKNGIRTESNSNQSKNW